MQHLIWNARAIDDGALDLIDPGSVVHNETMILLGRPNDTATNVIYYNARAYEIKRRSDVGDQRRVGRGAARYEP